MTSPRALKDQVRERRRLKRERTGPSPEKLAERHVPERDWVERCLWSFGVERRNRFKH